MADSASGMEKLISLLGGWPQHFSDLEIRHGLSLLAQLRREKLLDEGVFGLVVRYAVHRAAYDLLSAKIASQAEEAEAQDADAKEKKGDGYLSGDEQSRAFHENKLLILERELLATPYARQKSGGSAQTSFMELLDREPTDGGGTAKVMPFKPMARGGKR